jgi:hypothetical protein
MAVRQVRIEREVAPARREAVPVAERAALGEQLAKLRAGRENETAGADRAGDRGQAPRKVR